MHRCSGRGPSIGEEHDGEILGDAIEDEISQLAMRVAFAALLAML
jgi:hypothetical protein